MPIAGAEDYLSLLDINSFLHKQHFYKQHQAEIGKKLSKN